MNHKFRKKPVVVEAFQITHETRADNKNWPEWLNAAWNIKRGHVGGVSPKSVGSDGKDQLMIQTLEGAMTVGWDDYIIQGVSGELYACKPDIFEKTYEKVN
jgi:hypothetical protein